jgi:putative salt-induced outer membrane protein YdiY
MAQLSLLVAALLALAAVPAYADEVIFLNGDRLTGKIVSATGGKLVLKTDAAGEIVIDLSKVKTFSTDEAIVVKVGKDTPVSSKVSAAPADGQVQAQTVPGGGPQPLPIKDISAINPQPPTWHGSLALNGLFTSGNSNSQQIGFTGALNKRWESDRLTFLAGYTYGREEDPDTGDKTTTTDYGFASAKYDHFFTEKFYGYLLAKVEHDGVADLEYRFSPSIGVGYQWFEGPRFNFLTEVGLAYVYEKFKHEDAQDFLGPRFAYAVDWTPIPVLKLYHTFEYIPSFEDFTGDYLMNLVAGAKVKITKTFFADARFEWSYDSTPAPGRENSDTRFLIGVGWDF